MSGFTAKDMSSRLVFPDRSPGHPEFVLKRSKIVRNGQFVWLYCKTN